MKIKIFKGRNLERDINKWLFENEIVFENMTQSSTYGTTSITITYSEPQQQ